jgi:hypothetical protein
MYTIYLFAFIAILIVIVQDVLDGDFWDCLIMSIIFGFGGAVIGLLAAIALPVKYETTTWSEKIVSLKDNGSVSGSFFLGCGQINGAMMYMYYQQNKDSTFQMGQLNYSDAKIKYTNEQPKIDIFDTHRANVWWNKFAIDVIGEDKQAYIFEVPEGSINNSYELNSQ